MLKTHPAVFAVENNYQIKMPVNKECLAWVQVGDKTYYDDTNGILRSLSEIHEVTVPMAELDAAGGYTVCIRDVYKRGSWCSETADEVLTYPYAFTSVPAAGARAYCISDAHQRIEEPIRAARTFGDFDFLILNGDLCNCCDDPKVLLNTYIIAGELTGGTKPVVFGRGNHDLRGSHSEMTEKYTPHSATGRTYYTFRFGTLWGVVLDCGEDKRDDHIECGNVFCCHDFRLRETEYIRELTKRAATEYAAEGVTTRVVIMHYPISHHLWPDYEFEPEIYREWCRLLKEEVRPHVMICGHMHTSDIWTPGGEKDQFGQPCPIVLSGVPKENYFAGCGYVFGEDDIRAVHTDSNGEILQETAVLL